MLILPLVDCTLKDAFFDMDIETLSRLFASTYDPNPNVQKAGELEIRRVCLKGDIDVSALTGTDSRRSAVRRVWSPLFCIS